MAEDTPPAARSLLDVSSWLEGIKQLNGTRLLAVILGVFLWFVRGDIRDLVIRLDTIVAEERTKGRDTISDLATKIDRHTDAQYKHNESVRKLVEHISRRSTAEPPLIVIP